MKTRAIVLVTVLAALSLTAGPLLAAPPMADRFPAGSLVYIGWSGNTPALQESMMGQLMKEPNAVKLFAGLKSMLTERTGPEKGETIKHGLAIADILWQKPIAISLMSLEIKKDAPPELAAAALIDLGKDKAAFDEHLKPLLKVMIPEGKAVEAKSGDMTYQKVTPPGKGAPPISFGYIGDTFFIAIGETAVDTIALPIPGNKKTLADSEQFKKAQKALGGENEVMFIYVDAATLLAKVQAAAGEKDAENIKKVLTALGVEKATTLASSMRIVDKGFYNKSKIFSPAPHNGLLALAAGGTLKDEDLAMIPQDAEVVAAMKLSPKTVLDQLRRAIGADEGAKKEMDQGIKKFDDEMGISFENDLVPAIGDTWTVSMAPSLGGFLTGTVASVQVKDNAKLLTVLKRLEIKLIAEAAKADVLRDGPRDIDGPATRPAAPRVRLEKITLEKAEILYVSGGSKRFPMPVAPAWMVYNGRLFVAAFPQVLVSIVERKDAKSITTDAEFAAARARLSGKASGLCYIHTSRLLRTLYPLLLIGGSAGASVSEGAFKAEYIPSLAAIEKYLWPSIAIMSADDDGVTFESYSSIPQIAALMNPGSVGLHAAWIVPSVFKARMTAQKTVSQVNLHQVGQAVAMYRAENADKNPPDLKALVDAKILTPKTLRSPISAKTGDPLTDSDYVYMNVPGTAGSEVIIVYEKLENYKNTGTYVLFNDGHVEWMTKANFDKAMAKTAEYLNKSK